MALKETVVVPGGTRFYYIKTEAEIEAQRRGDIARGRTMTDDGETILYSKVGGGRFEADTPATITRRRGLEWPHWNKKPAHLVEGLATIRGVPRLVMFVLK